MNTLHLLYLINCNWPIFPELLQVRLVLKSKCLRTGETVAFYRLHVIQRTASKHIMMKA